MVMDFVNFSLSPFTITISYLMKISNQVSAIKVVSKISIIMERKYKLGFFP